MNIKTNYLLRAYTVLTISLLIGLALSGNVVAHGGATGIVKERMEVMDGIGKNMKSMKEMIQGKKPFDASKIAESANAIKQASENITDLFPHGSMQKPTEALPEIWQKWDDFSAIVGQLVTETGKLSEIAQGGEKKPITRQFAKVGKVCSSCHTDYRKKKKKN